MPYAGKEISDALILNLEGRACRVCVPGKTAKKNFINTVAEYFKISRERILKRRSKEKIPRQVAMYLCAVYCSSRVSMSNLGEFFSVSLSGIAIARDRVKKRIATGMDKVLIKAVNDIKKSTV